MPKTFLATLVALAVAAPAIAADYFVVVPVKGRTAAAPVESVPVENISVSLQSATLPAAMVGQAYSYNLRDHLLVTGDNALDLSQATLTTSDTLPAGLSLAANGLLTGTPQSRNGAGSSFNVIARYKGSEGLGAYSIAVKDPQWDDVIFAAGFDGSFTDERFGVEPTVINRTLNTTNVKSGSGSLFGEPAVGSNSTAHLLYPSRAEYAIGTGDYTVEAWVYRTKTNGVASETIVDMSEAGYTNCESGFCLFFDDVTSTTTKVGFLYNSGRTLNGATVANSTINNRWIHVAAVRQSGTTSLFVDGQKVAFGSDPKAYTAIGIRIGARTAALSSPSDYRPWLGYIDEVVITKRAKYTSNFTPAASLLAR